MLLLNDLLNLKVTFAYSTTYNIGKVKKKLFLRHVKKKLLFHFSINGLGLTLYLNAHVRKM